jgi:hypothetical protein
MQPQFPDIDVFPETLTVLNLPSHWDEVTFGHFGTSGRFSIARHLFVHYSHFAAAISINLKLNYALRAPVFSFS